MRSLKEEGNPLVLAGDGRSDSLGHSGSYSILELSCNKIIDFKLVQVYVMSLHTLYMYQLLHVYSYNMMPCNFVSSMTHRAMRSVAVTILWGRKVFI